MARLGISRHEDSGHPLGFRMLEHAMVRMAAIAVIDVASGRIEALAGALSPCTREEYDGPGRDPKCDRRLPYRPRYRPDALLNPAVFHDAMPASVIKPIMAEAFLTDPDVGGRWLAAERAAMRTSGIPAGESLRGELMRSASARFLDRMFCADQGFARCERPWRVQAMAEGFGWNGGCVMPREDCGKRDLLFGRAVDADADARSRHTARDGRPLRPAADRARGRTPRGAVLSAAGDRARQLAGAARARARRWGKCSGGAIVDVVAEGWGQGHARASALGVAGMMAFLAAAANGQAQVREPHLVSAVRGVAGDGSRATRARR